MKALTTSQQAIVDNLLKEFHGMNETNPIPFTLFNAQPILIELNAKKIEGNETDLHNKAMRENLNGNLNHYVNVLNSDFKNAELPIEAKLSGDTIIINGIIAKVGYMDNSYDVRLYTIKKYVQTKHGFSKTTTYLYANDTNNDDRHETIEKLLETDVFKTKMKRLIERCFSILQNKK